ncbi:hypothetical protein [Vampirovibrio chlorellavorus]|uniref:hypothetical protein n=1 Tax=Vampirovibrio chlorellavorus TaxID=758823 RepID=UPI0026EE8757|nr:hypothetical protein [Vampirovibrio chlorellavorus]
MVLTISQTRWKYEPAVSLSAQPPEPPDPLNPQDNPFLAIPGNLPLVALKGARNGYIMLAPATAITQYADLPASIWAAAQAWAAMLEQAGSPRVYTVILSEVTRHLHIHLFPRWPEDTLRGTALFDTRDTQPQPLWTPALQDALTRWAQTHPVSLG